MGAVLTDDDRVAAALIDARGKDTRKREQAISYLIRFARPIFRGCAYRRGGCYVDLDDRVSLYHECVWRTATNETVLTRQTFEKYVFVSFTQRLRSETERVHCKKRDRRRVISLNPHVLPSDEEPHDWWLIDPHSAVAQTRIEQRDDLAHYWKSVRTFLTKKDRRLFVLYYVRQLSLINISLSTPDARTGHAPRLSPQRHMKRGDNSVTRLRNRLALIHAGIATVPRDYILRETDPVQRFWDQVRKTDGECWVWTGPVASSGSGIFLVYPSSVAKSRTTTPARRYSYFLAHGITPRGKLKVICGNPACVRPDHLEFVSRRKRRSEKESVAPDRQCLRPQTVHD